jgi:hypothetical protein
MKYAASAASHTTRDASVALLVSCLVCFLSLLYRSVLFTWLVQFVFFLFFNLLVLAVFT